MSSNWKRGTTAATRRVALSIFLCALLSGCASTTVALAPSPQSPVCDPAVAALVLWAPLWRPDQKDVAEREDAAEVGLRNFFADSGCFARTELRRASDLGPATVAAQVVTASGAIDRVVTIGVRELGPIVKLLSSAALVEGGTEVVLQIATHLEPHGAQPREFTVRWQHGGPGVIKGVASLRGDMESALHAGLQPETAMK